MSKGGGKSGPSMDAVKKRRTLTFNPHKQNISLKKQAEKDNQLAAAIQKEVKKTTVHGKVDNLNASKFIELKGSAMFRMRLICSMLSGKSIRIDDIRSDDTKPGLRDYEVNFLRLLDRISNGTHVKISPTGTSVKFTPGVLIGGHDLQHECVPSRSVGYYLESLLLLGPFCKTPLEITLTNCTTNMDTDLSCDIVRAVTIPMMKHFGLGNLDTLGNPTPAPEFKLIKRGAPPLGGGEIFFKCPIIKALLPINLCDQGMFRRVRGLAYSTRCSPSLAQRMATSAKGMFMNYIADIHVYTDHAKGKDSGPSAGFAIGLAAESTTGIVISAQRTAMTTASLSVLTEKVGDAKGSTALAQRPTTAATNELEYEPGTAADSSLIVPEDVGRVCGKALLEEIAEGGCVDSAHQSMFCLLMALGPENISRARFGKLTTQTIQTLRLLREFWGITFRLQPDPKTKTVLVSCVGIGFMNMNRKVC